MTSLIYIPVSPDQLEALAWRTGRPIEIATDNRAYVWTEGGYYYAEIAEEVA